MNKKSLELLLDRLSEIKLEISEIADELDAINYEEYSEIIDNLDLAVSNIRRANKAIRDKIET